MTAAEKEAVVLLGVLRDRERLAGGLEAAMLVPYGPRRGLALMRVKAAREGIVPVDLAAWIGHVPTPSESTMFSRTYAALEAQGLVERHSGFGEGLRTSKLRLTAEGERRARELAASHTVA